MSLELVAMNDDMLTPDQAVEWVMDAYRQTVGGIVETGRRLNETKARVAHGSWLQVIDRLPFSVTTADRLMRIARHAGLSNCAHAHNLPSSWYTLAILAQLPADEIPGLIEQKAIHPETSRTEATKMVADYKGQTTPDPEPDDQSPGPQKLARAIRVEQITNLAKEGFTSQQIGSQIGLQDARVRSLAKDAGVVITADAVMKHRRKHDSNKVAANTVTALEGLALGLELIDYADLDPQEAIHWAASLRTTLLALSKFMKRIEELSHG